MSTSVLTNKRMKEKDISSIIIDVLAYGGVGLFSLICLFPFLHVLAVSVTPFEDYLKNPLMFLPKNINFDAYIQVLKFPLIYTGYRMTLFITVVGTILDIILLLMTAYPLSKKDLKGRNFFLTLIVFTMFFHGGLIPNYYLVRGLGWIDTPWALMIPGVIGAYHVILLKNFINQIPDSIEESAVIDGASEITVLFKIIIPLSKPAIAAFALFKAVNLWNLFFPAVVYTTKREYWPIMLVLRELVVSDNTSMVESGGGEPVTPYTLKMAIIIITILPIIMVYPFLQKYFMKGMMLGSVKG